MAEVVNDTFLVVWEQAGRATTGDGEVAAWLWGIAIRTLLHRLRPAEVGPRAARASCGREHLPSAEEAVLLCGRAQRRRAGAAAALPELLAVVQATVLDGLTTREAAALLGIPSGTVKSRMSRARLELREALL